jgi:hypothetical protein
MYYRSVICVFSLDECFNFIVITNFQMFNGRDPCLRLATRVEAWPWNKSKEVQSMVSTQMHFIVKGNVWEDKQGAPKIFQCTLILGVGSFEVFQIYSKLILA